MAKLTELHVQAAVWTVDGRRFPVLFLEGEAPDRVNGGMRAGALVQAVRARGLRLSTDPDQLPLRPVPGWRIELDDTDAITIEWPHFTPLLAAAAVPLPHGWRDAAKDLGAVVVLAGRGLGLREHAADGLGHATENLRTAAEEGAVAGGTVALVGSEPIADGLDGTITTPRGAVPHQPIPRASGARGKRRGPWWSDLLHGHPRQS